MKKRIIIKKIYKLSKIYIYLLKNYDKNKFNEIFNSDLFIENYSMNIDKIFEKYNFIDNYEDFLDFAQYYIYDIIYNKNKNALKNLKKYIIKYIYENN